MAKLLLCHPLFLATSPEERASQSPYFPLGLLYLAAYVRENGHQVAIFDGTFEEDRMSFSVLLDAEKPDLVGISVLLPTRDMALDLARRTKARGIPVMLGGPEPTCDPLSYMQHPQVDLVVHHEGEQTLVSLLNLFDAGALKPAQLHNELGIAYRDEAGQVRLNPPRPYITDLDNLPLPARDLIDMERYLDTWRENNGYASLTIATTRGCPYGCKWCQDAVHGNEFRQRSPEAVAAEMKMIKERYNIDRLRVIDDVDGIDREWLERWAAAADEQDAALPFEALDELKRQDIPLLEVRDSL